MAIKLQTAPYIDMPNKGTMLLPVAEKNQTRYDLYITTPSNNAHAYYNTQGQLAGVASGPTTSHQTLWVSWKDNDIFHATMEFTGEAVHNNSRVEVCDTQTGILYNLFPVDLAEYLAQGKVNSNGTITGDWKVVKRAKGFALVLV